MRKQSMIALAFGVAALGLPGAAYAGGIAEACYNKSYVSAKYAYGKRLVKGEYRSWSGLDNGPGLVVRYRHPPVYVQTSRMVAGDHYIMVPTSCK
jgi:hypothetical protein